MTHPNTDHGVTAGSIGEQAAAIRVALYRAVPNMPSYPVGIVEPVLQQFRLSSTAALEAEMKRLQQQIEYLTGVPSAPGVINDYRAPEIDAAVLRCRERGDGETAQILARMRLVYREQKDSLTDEIAFLKQRLESAEGLLKALCDYNPDDPWHKYASARTFLQELNTLPQPQPGDFRDA